MHSHERQMKTKARPIKKNSAIVKSNLSLSKVWRFYLEADHNVIKKKLT